MLAFFRLVSGVARPGVTYSDLGPVSAGALYSFTEELMERSRRGFLGGLFAAPLALVGNNEPRVEPGELVTLESTSDDRLDVILSELQAVRDDIAALTDDVVAMPDVLCGPSVSASINDAMLDVNDWRVLAQHDAIL